jgi:hypothetical protein
MHCSMVEKPQFLPPSPMPLYCAHQGYSIAAAGRANIVMAATARAATSAELNLIMVAAPIGEIRPPWS